MGLDLEPLALQVEIESWKLQSLKTFKTLQNATNTKQIETNNKFGTVSTDPCYDSARNKKDSAWEELH